MDKTVFQDMLEEFGAITTWSNEQFKVLMEKAKEVYGKGMVQTFIMIFTFFSNFLQISSS